VSRDLDPESQRFLFMKQYIYKLTAPNGKVYIGKSHNPTRRLQEHGRDSLTRDSKLYHSIRKYGWDSFTKEIVFEAECSEVLINRMERLYIAMYDSLRNGLNMTSGGDGFVGARHSDSAKAKMSATRKGRKLPPEHVAKIAASRVAGGYSHSEETRSKIARARLGTTLSPETRAKQSATHLRQGRGRIPIEQYTKEGEFIQVWPSLAQAAKEFGITKQAISECLKMRNRSAGGYVWRYA
jgi:group I intron endonuclease